MKAESKPRIAVISPFLDKRHGTELCIAEQIEKLADEFDFHVYSTRISDMDTRRFTWHRIPDLPGPHLFKYIWFFCANHARRRFEGLSGKNRPELTYSPGINCFDAGVISVHIVFAEFRRLAAGNLALRANPVSSWVRLIHRRMFYSLVIWLEKRIYTRRLPLIAVSGKVKVALARHYQVEDAIVIPNGISSTRFNPEVRDGLRVSARKALGFSSSDFVLLLIGNDWRKKGLICLLQALASSKTEQLKLVVVGRDEVSPFRTLAERYQLGSRVHFLAERADPEFYYAAADAYVGPSVEDAFAIPPLEAMACGLPTIVSSRAGVSEIVTHGMDGLVLLNPEDPSELAGLIAQIYNGKQYREHLGRSGAKTASQFTWERNAEQMRSVFHQFLAGTQAQSVTAPRTV
jgi:glycosyltransferase involved in cell wall biosynthesis